MIYKDVERESMSYKASSIKVLRGLQAVRKTPGMYLGDISDGTALHHLIWEVLDNSVDEHLAGYCDHIRIVLSRNGTVLVQDNGRGIPFDSHDEGIPAAQLILSTLHAGGKFDNDSYAQSAGLHGVGLSAVNAVSESLHITVCRDGKRYEQAYRFGVPEDPKIIRDKKCNRGTTIQFTRDTNIFTDVLDYSYDKICNRAQELSVLNAGLRIDVEDCRGDTVHNTFWYEGGLQQYVHSTVPREDRVHPDPLRLEHQIKSTKAEIVLQWTQAGTDLIRCYTNNVWNSDGGTHLTGLKNGLTRLISSYVKEFGHTERITGEDVREGLVAYVNLRLPSPSFSSQTKEKLVTAGAKQLVENAVLERLGRILDTQPSLTKALTDRVVTTARAREAARRAKERTRRSTQMDPLGLPGKLSDCQIRDAKQCEILIVEGDSAGGSTKQGRDRRFQAVMPLRGKVLNTENVSPDTILNNNELGSLVSVMGCGLESAGSFDITRLRYDRIIILTDADVDGAHIQTLLLTFFYRHMPQLVYGGHIYMGCPPLYHVRWAKKSYYFITQVEYDAFMEDCTPLQKKGMKVTRYKGLGEMNPETLWETTLNPENRTLLQVGVQDAVQAEALFETLMGSNVESRKQFIENNAEEAFHSMQLDV